MSDITMETKEQLLIRDLRFWSVQVSTPGYLRAD
jgi:hypothetical protein